MFLNFIKQFLINRRLKSLVKLNRHFSIPKEIKEIHVLIDIRYFDKTNEFLNKLKIVFGKNSKINILNYDSKIRKNHLEGIFFYNKHITLKGKFYGEAKLFIEQKSDVFICYSDLDNAFINWLSFHKKSDFKVGFYQTNPKIFDILINSENKNYEENITELGKYINIINNKKK